MSYRRSIWASAGVIVASAAMVSMTASLMGQAPPRDKGKRNSRTG